MNRFLHAAFLASLVCTTFSAWGQIIYEDLELGDINDDQNGQFGQAIAIDNGLIAVGVPRDNQIFPDAGTVHLFNGGTGALLHELFPNEESWSVNFGLSLAVADSIVAVGAPRDNENGNHAGAVYLFNATTGAQIEKLLPDDGASGDNFGVSVAMDGGILAVGSPFDDDNGSASGSVYLFYVNDGTQFAKIAPDDAEAGDNFGTSIDVGSGYVVVGAILDDDNGLYSGSAYVFEASTGDFVSKFLASDGAYNDQLGRAIAIDNGVVIVGASFDFQTGGSSSSAYLFDAATGAQIDKILPDNGVAGDRFGWAVGIGDGVAVVGAYEDTYDGKRPGSAYLFDISTGDQIVKLIPSDGVNYDVFGSAIALDNGIVAVGAAGADDIGSAYLYDISGYIEVSATPRAVPGLTLWPNYPNPFNPQTTIAFEIPEPETLYLRVFDMSGRLLRELIVAEEYAPGRHEVVWNGRNDSGQQVASGTYFYRLDAGSFSEAKRMVLVK